MNKKIIAPIVTAGAMLATSIGSTFALFTSKASSSISINSGRVDISANLSDLSIYSASLTDDDETGVVIPGSHDVGEYSADYYYVKQAENFINGGTAELNDEKNKLILSNITPGDKVTLNLNIENESNINIKYRLRVYSENPDLFKGLKFNIDGFDYSGIENICIPWQSWEPNEPTNKTLGPISIVLPITAGNEWQNKTSTIDFVVDAVQGNAYVTDPNENEVFIDSVNADLERKHLAYPSLALNELSDSVKEELLSLDNLVWNDEYNLFGINEDGIINYATAKYPVLMDEHVWEFSNTYLSDDQPVYLMGNTFTGTLNISNSIDVGENSPEVINYENGGEAKNVVIHTNSFATRVILSPFVDSLNDTKGDHIEFYGDVSEVTGPKDLDGNYTGFVCAFNSVVMNGRFIEVKVEKGRIDVTNADDTPYPVYSATGLLVGYTWPEVCATSTDVQAINNSDNTIHFHAYANTVQEETENATTMNEATGDRAKSGKVIWDHRENEEQNYEECYHHVVDLYNKTEENKDIGVWTNTPIYDSDKEAEETKKSIIEPFSPQGTEENPFRVTNGQEWTEIPDHALDGEMTYFLVENNFTLVDDELLNLPSGMQATIDMNNCSVSAGGNYAPVTNWGSLVLKNGKLDTMLVDGYTCVHNHGNLVLNGIEIHSTWSGVYNYNENPETPALLEVYDSNIYGNNVAIYNGAFDYDEISEEEYESQFGRVVIHSGTFESVGFGDDDLGWDAIVSTKPEYVKIIDATLIDGSYSSVFSCKGMLDVGSTVTNAYQIDDIYTDWGSVVQKTVFVIEPSEKVECSLQFEGENAVQYASLINAVEIFKTNSKNAILKLESDFIAEQFDLFLLPDLSFESSMGNLVFDLNGYTYTNTEYSIDCSGYTEFEGINLTIIDSSASHTGKYCMTNVSEYVISITNGVFNFNSGEIENTCSQGSNYCFYIGTNGTLNISGGIISENKQNIKDEETRKKTIFTISNSSQSSTINITGGTICGKEFELTQEYVDFIQTLVSNANYVASIQGDAVIITYQPK